MPKRRWLQFSLRTGFIVVTGFCVALSVWVVPAERQRRAVKAIEAAGGSVIYADSEESSESLPVTFLRRWLPPVYVYKVNRVKLADTRVTDNGLAHLRLLTGLKLLNLSGTQITNAGLVHVRSLTGLRSLNLSETQVTDDGLLHLQRLTGLRLLFLSNTQVTDEGLTHLQELTALRGLDVCNTHVTDTGLSHLEGLTDLVDLRLTGTLVTDSGVAQLRKALPKCYIGESFPKLTR